LPPNLSKKPLSDVVFIVVLVQFISWLKKLKAFGESESLLQTLDEIGKTGLYLLEPHHQRLKRIASFIFMCQNIGTQNSLGKGCRRKKSQSKKKTPVHSGASL